MGEWIEHDGRGCPVPKGTMVEAIDRRGVVDGPFPAMCMLSFDAPVGTPIVGNAWQWGSNPACTEYEIIAYRLSDTDDKAKREARMELFRGIAKSKEFLIEETLKPREKVQ